MVGIWGAALIATAGHAAAPAPDQEKEIAWARARWPDELRGVHLHAPLRKLLAWLPRSGAMNVYLYTGDFACRRATLSRRPPDEDAEEAPPPALVARVNGRPKMESGERVREVTLIDVGVLLSEEGGYTLEQQGSDGRWTDAGGGSGYGPTVYGALSYVDDRVARWDGAAMELHAYCGGPVEWLSCPAGGERPCLRCETVDVVASELNAMTGHGFSHGDRPVTCHDACPTYPETPDLERLLALGGRVQPWQPRNARVSQIPSLYKSRDDCLRDHPAGR
jgi:hypothetical protein